LAAPIASPGLVRSTRGQRLPVKPRINFRFSGKSTILPDAPRVDCGSKLEDQLMRQLALIAAIAIAAAGSADAKPARTLQDLVGARGSSGEMALHQRGFVAGKSNLAQGGRVVFWGNASDGTCV
jgi:hypothetical protein